jgi:hypothetical protein
MQREQTWPLSPLLLRRQPRVTVMTRKPSKKKQAADECQTPTGDGMEVKDARQYFNQDAVSWLVGEGIRNLHACDDQQALAYRRIVELLAQSAAATKAVAQIVRSVAQEDVNLRWSLLYLLADTGDPAAADVFVRVACEPIEPRERDRRACETPRDGEVLVRTMAIEGLGRVAASHKEAVEKLYRVIEAQPEPALRIEAVKAILAAAPGEADRLKKILPESLHFALTLQRVKAESLAVEFEKAATDKVRQMPHLDQVKTTPTATPMATCCKCG